MLSEREDKVMKKILVAIILLAVFVGVSYIKSIRQKKQTTAVYEQGRKESVEQQEKLRTRVDSLSYLIEQQEVEYAKSMWQREMAYSSANDSLAKMINSEKADSMDGDPESLQTAKETVSTSIESSETAFSRHKQILDYYQRQYQALPKDLSPYEKKVAMGEIKELTTQKFSISLKELNNIRKDNKLDY